MNAGKSKHPVGTRVRITGIADDQEADWLGMTGELTHPFLGLKFPGVRYTVGVRLDNGKNINLIRQDKFEVVKG